MSAKDIAAVLWRRKLVSLVIAAVVIIGGFGFLMSQPDVWESSSSIALLPEASNPNVVPNYGGLVDSLVPTYIQLISSESFLNGVARTLPFPTTGAYLSKHVSGRSVTNAGVVQIVADMPQPVQAEQVATATTSAFEKQLKNNGIVVLQVFDAPRVPNTPISPRPKLVIGATVAIAIILGLAAGLAWERLFARVFTADELVEAAGLPVIGLVQEERRLRTGTRLILGQAGLGRLEESIRSLRTNFVFALSGERPRSVTVTSLGPTEGKTTVAVNLAVVTAELGYEVVLIDGDVHRPAVHDLFHLENAEGLTTTTRRHMDPRRLLRQVPGVTGLEVVTAGPPLHDPSDEVNLYLHKLPQMAEMGDIVIVDSPPLRAGADIRLLASATDAVLLVVRSGANTARQLKSAIESLAAVNVPVLGLVLTRTHETPRTGGALSYYSYRDSYRGAESAQPHPHMARRHAGGNVDRIKEVLDEAQPGARATDLRPGRAPRVDPTTRAGERREPGAPVARDHGLG